LFQSPPIETGLKPPVATGGGPMTTGAVAGAVGAGTTGAVAGAVGAGTMGAVAGAVGLGRREPSREAGAPEELRSAKRPPHCPKEPGTTSSRP
jgi:hypothetical protein